MKTWKKMIGVSLVPYLLGLNAFADSEIVASGQSVQASLGDGYNSATQLFVGTCIENAENNLEWAGQQSSSIQFERSMTETQARNSLGFGTQARAKYGMSTMTAAASFARETSSDQYSESATYSAQTFFKNRKIKRPILTALAQTRKNNMTAFKKACGNEFVDQIQLGASLFVNLKVQFARKEDKESFSAQVGMSGPMYSVSASLQTAARNFKRSGYVSVKLLQIGGDVSRLSTIFNAATGSIPNAVSPTQSSPLAIVNCSMEDLKACVDVLQAAVKYASEDLPRSFPAQIDPNTNPVNQPNGPAVLKYLTKSWEAAGVAVPNPIANATAMYAQKEISTLFENQLKISNRLRALGIARIRLSPAQRAKVQNAEWIVDANLSAISDAAKICYDDEARCLSQLQILRGTPTTAAVIQEMNEADLEINPETFAQYCDIVQMPKYSKRMGDLVNAIMDVAVLDVSDGSWNDSADRCALAEDLVQKVRTFSLPFKMITDISVLTTLPNIRSLYLNGNRIESIAPLSNVKSLEYVSVSGNPLNDLSPLKDLPNLKQVLAANTQTLGDEASIRASMPKVNFSFTPSEVCKTERNRVRFAREILDAEFPFYEANDMAPVYAKPGDRRSGINLWKSCFEASFQL